MMRAQGPTLLGALLLGGCLATPMAASAQALGTETNPQTTPASSAASESVEVQGTRLEREGRDSLLVEQTRIAKGQQALRDIPQSITVITERLIDDRNIDTLKEALKQTAGISFLAAEGGEEDIRLRGFSLQATGDLFLDGMREPAFYERDSFALDRLEILRGSASMLFGRGSTGGAVNQVLRVPRSLDERSVDITLGSHRHQRTVVDVNTALSADAGLRFSVMHTDASNNGSGSSIDKTGLMGALRWGIGGRDEFLLQAFHLENRNGMNYGLPWIRPTVSSPAQASSVMPLDPANYYGMASDLNHGKATHLAGVHTHRWSAQDELRTQVRLARYERNQRASTIRLAAAEAQPSRLAASLESFGPETVFTRGTQLKIQDMDTAYIQSDYSSRFTWAGLRHQVTAGIDTAAEQKSVYAARSGPDGRGLNVQGGVTLTKPNTVAGNPNDGVQVDESARVLRLNNHYQSGGWGSYVQDLVQLSGQWKLLGGLRWDSVLGNYDSFAAPTSAVDNGAKTSYRMKVGVWSQRVGALFQPDAHQSYHASAGTSFNTSGDTYSLSAANLSTPPEKSINLELGGKIDSPGKRLSTRWALFRATKLHERNTDPLLPVVTLTGRRHVAGLEWDVAGRLTSALEMFGSFTWLPVAKVDEAAPCPSVGTCAQSAPGERPGDRTALTPVHSGSVWATWQVDSRWRTGGGVTLRGPQRPTRAEFDVRGFAVADAMLEYAATDAAKLKLNVSNIANKLYADQLYTGHYVPGAGRLIQLTMSYRE